MDPKSILIKVGPQHLAKGLERGYRELDNILVGWPIQPSLVANLGTAAVGLLGAFFAPAPLDEILAIWGGHHSTTLWDYIEAMIPPAGARVRTGLSYIPSTGAFVPTRPGLGETIRYAPEQRVVTAPKFIPGVLRPKYQHGA